MADDGVQWILEWRTAGGKHSRGSAYCCTRAALIRNVLERAGEITTAGRKALEALPEQHP